MEPGIIQSIVDQLIVDWFQKREEPDEIIPLSKQVENQLIYPKSCRVVFDDKLSVALAAEETNCALGDGLFDTEVK